MSIGEGNKLAYIYKIECLLNKKVYIGSTVNFIKRKSEHLKELRLGIHHCKPLQNSYDKYGSEYFLIVIIETFSYNTKSDILNKEQQYLNSPGLKFNTYLTAGSPLGTKYGTYSKERRQKLSEGMKGIRKTEDHKKLLSEIKLKGTANNKPVISIDANGDTTEYLGVCHAARVEKVGVQSIYDSINKIPKKWKSKTSKQLTWMYKPAIA